MSKGKRISQEQYQDMLASYREDPSNYNKAANSSGCTWATAKKAWLEGWPDLEMPAIHDVLQGEQHAARAKLQRSKDQDDTEALKEAEEARNQAISARKDEGRLVELARKSAAQGLATTHALSESARSLAMALLPRLDLEVQTLQQWTRYETQVLHAGDAADNKPLRDGWEPTKVLSTIRTITELMRQMSAISKETMELERLYLGAPTTVIGLTAVGPGTEPELTMAELEARIYAAAQAVENVRKARGLYFSDGSVDTTADDEELIGEPVQVERV